MVSMIGDPPPCTPAILYQADMGEVPISSMNFQILRETSGSRSGLRTMNFLR